MKVNNTAAPAYVSKQVETYQASISMTKEVFDILVKGIYKNPYLALVREYACNAKDSHISAKKYETPIEIHFPTNLEPWFSVKDYGLGMSKEMVTQTFMCLGTSTKRDSDELVGSKGIGSKVAFSLTDAYSVISVYEGVKTSYSIYMNKGIPDIAVIMSNPTTECNGVEIKVAIEDNFISKVNEAAVEFLSLFDFPYTYNEGALKTKPVYPEVAYTHHYEDFKVEILANDKGIVDQVIMGGVGYDSTLLSDQAENYLITVPIGAVDISPGREYTEENDNPEFVEKLNKACTEASIAYSSWMNEQLTLVQNITELKTLYKSSNIFMQNTISAWFNSYFEKLKLTYARYKYTIYSENRRGWNLNFSGSNKEISNTDFLYHNGIFMLADKANQLKQRAIILKDKLKSEYIVTLRYDDEILKHPFFSDAVYMASEAVIDADLPKEKKTRQKVVRDKGHKVGFISSKEEGVEYENLTKDEISEIEFYLTKNNSLYYTEEFGHVGFKRDVDMLNYYNIDKVYILSSRQIKWVTKGKVFKPEVPEEFKGDLLNWHLRLSDYNDVVENYNFLRKVKGEPGRFTSATKVDVPSWINLRLDTSKIKSKAEEKSNKLKKSYDEELAAFVAEHPLLGKFVDEDDWMCQEVQNYLDNMRKLKQYEQVQENVIYLEEKKYG